MRWIREGGLYTTFREGRVAIGDPTLHSHESRMLPEEHTVLNQRRSYRQSTIQEQDWRLSPYALHRLGAEDILAFLLFSVYVPGN